MHAKQKKKKKGNKSKLNKREKKITSYAETKIIFMD